MARIQIVEGGEAAWWLRLVYRLASKAVGKRTGKADLGDALKLIAHCPRLFWGTVIMESGQLDASAVPATLKSLALLRVSTIIGCPY